MAFSSYPAKGGIPSGNTASRPASPAIGDTYYDGTLGFLLIWDGTSFIPCSAPAAQPSIAVADVGTSQPYAAPTATVTFTEGISGGKAGGFTALQSSYSATSTSNPITLAVGGPGTLAFSGTAYNGFGTSPSSLTVNQTITSVPQAPTIGTATASTSANELTVNWTNAATGGKALSSITITPYLNGTTAETARTAATTSSTSYTFTSGQLTGGSTYTFKVKATNANGDGLESAASNSLAMPDFVLVDYLVIAGGGGGGGGGGHGAGGGAGGYRTNTSAAVSKGTNYTVTIGAGGAGGLNSTKATNGSNSVFNTITSSGGGAGGQESGGFAAANGGSGGGAWHTYNTPGSGNAGGFTPPEGNNGGTGSNGAPNYGEGGGGGAGAVGGNGTSTVGGSGGSGSASSITGTSVTRAGGGGGSTYTGGTAGAGGAGGGGAGVANGGTAGAGTVNTGGGGGGNERNPANPGGAGGSGVVILRYLTSAGTITIGAGLTGSTATDGSSKVTTITAGSGNVSWA